MRDATLRCIKATALYWGTYKKWTVGPVQVRQYYMKQAMRDLMLLCALFRVENRKGAYK